MDDRESKRLLWTGLIGSGLVALCCFTPILGMLLGVVGFGAMTGYLDYVLLPALCVFVGLTVYAVSRKRPIKRAACCAHDEPNGRHGRVVESGRNDA